MRRVITALLVGAMGIGISEVHANAPTEGVNYVSLAPPIIVNFDGPGRNKYIKAELSIRAENATDAGKILHHLPLIRDRVVSILAAQSEDSVVTPEGKESLRRFTLSEINRALLEVEGFRERRPLELPEPGRAAQQQADITAGGALATNRTPVPPKRAPRLEIINGPASDVFFNNFVIQK